MANLMSFQACLVGEICHEKCLINHMRKQIMQIVHFLYVFDEGSRVIFLRQTHELLFDDSRTFLMSIGAKRVCGRTCSSSAMSRPG